MVDCQMVAPTSIDAKELVARIDTASGLLAHAAATFADLSAVFEAINAAAPQGSLMSRLATLGMNMCESSDSDFTGYRDDYNAHVEHYSDAYANGAFLRIQLDKDSLSKGTA